MSHKTYRINAKINSGEKVLKVNLKQGINTFNILSLDVHTEDDYQLHTSNYGVIVGRVLANEAFGVPNVKVSVFIPLSNEDQESYIISNEYPYRTTQSVNNDGIKYNLLSNEAFPGLDGKHKNVGTFPNKRLVLDNDGQIEVFEKYWKYTTTTNESGDYMIFGVPTGTCQVHYDCDLSDIGLISQKPYDFINKGYSPQLFKSPTEFNDDMADSAIQVLRQDKTVFVYPFWGDKNANQIGITRNDITLDYKFEPSCVFMGSSITDSAGTYIGTYGMPNGNNGRFKSLSTSSGDIEIIRQTQDGYIEEVKENVTGIIDGDGVWCYAIPMNLDRIGTDEEGNIVPISDPHKGIPTRARVRFRISLTNAMDESNSEYTAKVLVPCNPKLEKAFSGKGSGVAKCAMPQEELNSLYEFGSKTPDSCFRDLYWGKVYSIKQYLPRIQIGYKSYTSSEKADIDYANYPLPLSVPFSSISSIDAIAGLNSFPYNTMYAGAENKDEEKTRAWFLNQLSDRAVNGDYSSKGLHFCFENDWINGCLYFPRVKIGRNKDGSYAYFGESTVHSGISITYLSTNVYISGRHNLLYEDNEYGIKMNNERWARWKKDTKLMDIDKTTCFGSVVLDDGLLSKITTRLGEHVFYYKSIGYMYDLIDPKTYYVRLYATDIILLGNMVDVYDTLPKLFQNIPSTTTIFPPLLIPKSFDESGMNQNCYEDQLNIIHGKKSDTDDVDVFGNYTKLYGGDVKIKEYNYDNIKQYDGTPQAKELYQQSTTSNITLSHSYCKLPEIFIRLRYIAESSSLFFGYRARNAEDFLCYFWKSGANLSRICELDVINDSAYKYINQEEKVCKYIPVNGVIDRFDIQNDDNRSLFASMNYDINKTSINPQTGYRRFVPTILNMVDFEGRLKSYFPLMNMLVYDENPDPSYIKFRFNDNGNGPLLNSFGKEPIILTENSFYFYFGLHSGKSAIDSLKSKYYGVESNGNPNSNLITITLNDSVCSGSTLFRNVQIEINPKLSKTYECYIYSGNDIVQKATTTSGDTSFSFDLPVGLYKAQIIDSANKTIEQLFPVYEEPLNIDYTLDSISHTCEFKNINGEIIETIQPISENTLEIPLSNKTWILNFDKTYNKQSGTTIQFEKTSNEVTITAYCDRLSACTQYNLLLPFDNSMEGITLNEVPVKVIKHWTTSIGDSNMYMWSSINTAFTQKVCQLDYTNLSGYTDTQKIQHLSNMLSCVYDEVDMRINASNSYTAYTITPNTGDLIESLTNPKEMWNKHLKYIQCSNNSIILNDMQFPHIVGQNYPNDLDIKSGFKKKKGGIYENNATLTSNNGKFIGYNYVGLGYQHDEKQDKPKALSPKINGNVLCDITDDEIQNYFQIQTVDKRFDYEGLLRTPLILPSGYDSFKNLSQKALCLGKTTTTIYGGLRFDHDENKKVTCYRMEKYNITGDPTSGATLYTQSIFEDNEKNQLTGITNTHINNINYNDEICVSTALSGNTYFGVDLVGCSGDLSHWQVKPGKRLSYIIPYTSGIELIQSDITDDYYDVVYKSSSNNSSTYIASLSGSSLSFKIAKTELYEGDTYTNINVNKSKLKYPGWAEDNTYFSDRTYDLSILACSGSSLDYCDEYQLTRTEDTSQYPNLKYDTEKYYSPFYKDSDDDIHILNDNDINSVYTFTLTGDKTKSINNATYLVIPTRKVYKENQYTLLRQKMVYNIGYAYYVDKINVTQSGNTVTVQLKSPLLNQEKKIEYNKITSLVKNGDIHTIGTIQEYYCADGDVAYDPFTLTFTITINPTKTNGVLPFYFRIENGLKYKVNIKLK